MNSSDEDVCLRPGLLMIGSALPFPLSFLGGTEEKRFGESLISWLMSESDSISGGWVTMSPKDCKKGDEESAGAAADAGDADSESRIACIAKVVSKTSSCSACEALGCSIRV